MPVIRHIFLALIKLSDKILKYRNLGIRICLVIYHMDCPSDGWMEGDCTDIRNII